MKREYALLLQKYFETRLELIDQELKNALSLENKYATELKKAMYEAVIPGGKRWRPLLLLSMFEMLTGFKKHRAFPDAVKSAVAIELLHNGAIVHDDLPSVMNRTQRRAQPALHIKYGNAIAILAADALYSLAYEIISELKNPEQALEAIRILSNATKSYGMIGGQVVALSSRHKVMKINTLNYIDRKKVGSLLQAAADIACLLGKADEETHQVMRAYALNLGIAYQMIEDIEADYSRGSEGLDDEYIPVSKASYTALLGFDKARKTVENMLADAVKMLKPYPKNSILLEFVAMIKERLP